ncbi:hypothetical protein H0E87_031515, partial [Populus deltoides]
KGMRAGRIHASPWTIPRPSKDLGGVSNPGVTRDRFRDSVGVWGVSNPRNHPWGMVSTPKGWVVCRIHASRHLKGVSDSGVKFVGNESTRHRELR